MAALVELLVRGYQLDQPPSLTFIRHGENTTYRCETVNGQIYAARLHRSGYQTPDAIRSEVAWTTALRSAGILTPAAVPGANGSPVQEVVVDGLNTHLTLHQWIDGIPMNARGGLYLWEELGGLMAQIHEHSSTWARPANFSRPAWDEEAMVGDTPRWGCPALEDFNRPDRRLLEQVRREVKARLGAIEKRPDNYGLIHGDLSFENVLVTPNQEMAVIDFDDGGESWFVTDLAVALSRYEGSTSFEEKRDALVRGYRRRRALPDAMVEELPTFLMARRIAVLGWLQSRGDTRHAHEQRTLRHQSTPRALRDFTDWLSQVRRQRPPEGSSTR